MVVKMGGGKLIGIDNLGIIELKKKKNETLGEKTKIIIIIIIVNFVQI